MRKIVAPLMLALSVLVILIGPRHGWVYVAAITALCFSLWRLIEKK